MKPNDIFEANDLFENGNLTQVQTTLLALANMVSHRRPTMNAHVFVSSVFALPSFSLPIFFQQPLLVSNLFLFS